MDISVVGEVMNHRAKVDTLEKVNVSLLKTTNAQAEQQATKLLESVAPVEPTPEGNKGHNINVSVWKCKSITAIIIAHYEKIVQPHDCHEKLAIDYLSASLINHLEQVKVTISALIEALPASTGKNHDGQLP